MGLLKKTESYAFAAPAAASRFATRSLSRSSRGALQRRQLASKSTLGVCRLSLTHRFTGGTVKKRKRPSREGESSR